MEPIRTIYEVWATDPQRGYGRTGYHRVHQGGDEQQALSQFEDWKDWSREVELYAFTCSRREHYVGPENNHLRKRGIQMAFGAGGNYEGQEQSDKEAVYALTGKWSLTEKEVNAMVSKAHEARMDVYRPSLPD